MHRVTMKIELSLLGMTVMEFQIIQKCSIN